jgi:uncharacterized protein
LAVQAVTTTDDVLSRLGENASRIRAYGVARLALFGSFARDQAQAGSDVDLLVDFEPGQKTYDRFLELALFLEGVLGRRVELLTRESLSPYIGPAILAEARDLGLGA